MEENFEQTTEVLEEKLVGVTELPKLLKEEDYLVLLP